MTEKNITRIEKFNDMTTDEKLTLYYLEMIHFYLLWKSIHAMPQTTFIYNFLKMIITNYNFDELISKLDNKAKYVLQIFIINFFNITNIDHSYITQAAFGQLAKHNPHIKNDCLHIIDILQQYILNKQQIKGYDKNMEYFLLMASKHGNSSIDELTNYFKSYDPNKINYMMFPQRIGSFYALFDTVYGTENIIFMYNIRETHINYLIENMKLLPKEIKYNNTIQNIVYGTHISYCTPPGFCVKKSKSICVLHNMTNTNIYYKMFDIKPDIMDKLITNHNECHRVHTLLHEMFGHGSCLDHPGDHHDVSVLKYEESYADMVVLYMIRFPDLLKKISNIDYLDLRLGIFYINVINHLFILQNIFIGNNINVKNYTLGTMILLKLCPKGINLSHSYNDKIKLNIDIDIIYNNIHIIEYEMIRIHQMMKNKNIILLEHIFNSYMMPTNNLINILNKLIMNINDETIVDNHLNVLPIINYNNDIVLVDNNLMTNYIIQFNEVEKLINK